MMKRKRKKIKIALKKHRIPFLKRIYYLIRHFPAPYVMRSLNQRVSRQVG
jgi:hypothetical protein